MGKGFIRGIITKSQADNNPREFMIAIGVVTIVFLLVCGGIASGFFEMITSVVEAVSSGPGTEAAGNIGF